MNSDVEPWDARGLAFFAPGNQSGLDVVTVTVRDGGGAPISGALVEIDVSSCAGSCFDVPDDGLTGTTGVGGSVTLDPRVGGCGTCNVVVRADGVELRTFTRLVSTDWDGQRANGVVDGADSTYFAGEFLTQGVCSDYNGDGTVDFTDFFTFMSSYSQDEHTVPCLDPLLEPRAVRDVDPDSLWVGVFLPGVTVAGDSIAEILPSGITLEHPDSLFVWQADSDSTANLVDVTGSMNVMFNDPSGELLVTGEGAQLLAYKMSRPLAPGESITGTSRVLGERTTTTEVDSLRVYLTDLAEASEFDDPTLGAALTAFAQNAACDTIPELILYNDMSITTAQWTHSFIEGFGGRAFVTHDATEPRMKLFATNTILGNREVFGYMGSSFCVRGCDPRVDTESGVARMTMNDIAWYGCIGDFGECVFKLCGGGYARIRGVFTIVEYPPNPGDMGNTIYEHQFVLLFDDAFGFGCQEQDGSTDELYDLILREGYRYLAYVLFEVDTGAAGGWAKGNYNSFSDDGTPGVTYTDLDIGFDTPAKAELHTDDGDFSLSPSSTFSGDWITATHTVHNYGYEDAGPVAVNYYLNGALIDPDGNGYTHIISSIPKCGGSVQYTTEFCAAGPPGANTLEVIVDPADKVNPDGSIDEVCEDPAIANGPCMHTVVDTLFLEQGPAAATYMAQDKSLSMNGPGSGGPTFADIQLAFAEAWIDQNNDTTAVGIANFGVDVSERFALTFMDDDARTAAKQQAASIGVDQSLTNMYDAIHLGIRELSCLETSSRAVLLFTDGGENVKPAIPDDGESCHTAPAAVVADASAARVPIIGIQPLPVYEDDTEPASECVPYSAQRDSLRRIVVDTGGALYDLADTTAAVVDSLVQELLENLPDAVLLSPIGQPALPLDGAGQRAGSVAITVRAPEVAFPTAVTLEASPGVSFAKVPTVRATNLSLGNVVLDPSGMTLTIGVDAESCTDCLRTLGVGGYPGLLLDIVGVTPDVLAIDVTAGGPPRPVPIGRTTDETVVTWMDPISGSTNATTSVVLTVVNVPDPLDGVDLIDIEDPGNVYALGALQTGNGSIDAEVPPGVPLGLYELRAHGPSATDAPSTVLYRSKDIVVNVSEEGPELHMPVRFALHPNTANPFNPATRIAYDVPTAADVRVSIFDVSGRRVIDLAHGPATPGRHETTWAGVDTGGRPVAGGVYFLVMKTRGFHETRKMVLTR